MKRALVCVLLFACGCGVGISQTARDDKPALVAPSGDSSLVAKINGKKIRVTISTYKIDIGRQDQTPPPTGEAKINCTYSRLPCSQVSNLRISVKGERLFIPRSVFADRTDVGSMSVKFRDGLYLLELGGGDASEAYSLKVFFTAHRVQKRKLYDSESNSLVEVTTYVPPSVMH
jgi:hypothetical protein